MTSAKITWKTYLLPPLHEEGPWFVGVFALIALVLWWIWTPLGLLGAALTVWCFYFFRDADRVVPQGDDLIVSPADGIVQMIGEAPVPPELDMGGETRTRISIFMSVFDCHVNRAPMAGRLEKVVYVPGLFLNASLDKASEDNERQIFLLKAEGGARIPFVQIAGLVARRIRREAREGQEVSAGERIGLIRFGSRVDVYLPEGTAPLVCVGQKMVSGETVLAELGEDDAREGEAV